MAFPGEKYPLDMGEQNCLISNMLASESLLLLIGVVGSMIASGIASGDWFGSIIGFGWAHEIALSCMKLSAIDTIVAAIVVTAIALAVAHAIELVASHTTSGRLSIIASRRGLNGEIPRIDSYAVFAGMAAAGFAEELLFRFVLVGGVAVLLSLFIPAKIAVIAAIVISTAVFVYAHEEYRDWYTLLVCVAMSLVMCVAFAVTGSYVVVALAHAAYDIIDIEIEGSRMVNEDDYFFGEVPQSVMLDMYEEICREENERANRKE